MSSGIDRGFAVVDLETTGLFPGRRDRVVEIGVVLVDIQGRVVGDWSSLVNPCRDVGPTSIHGLRPRDLVKAPLFGDIAGELAEVLAGQVVVAHNLSFDARFLAAEYSWLGYADVPVGPEYGVCTMRLASQYLPFAPRTLAGCCAAVGWQHENAHTALADAYAAARLLEKFLECAQGDEDWLLLLDEAPSWYWPEVAQPVDRRATLPREKIPATLIARTMTGTIEGHFLGRLVTSLPRVPDPSMADPYLAVLDDVLADRRIDPGEADSLVALAGDLGLDRPMVEGLHRTYLGSLARAAWENGVVTDLERGDLNDVANLLGLDVCEVVKALAASKSFTGSMVLPTGSLRLCVGDRICFTGQMGLPREELEEKSIAAGLRVTSSVSGKTKFLVCADADSMSGKAKKARTVGVTVMSEMKFYQLLTALKETT